MALVAALVAVWAVPFLMAFLVADEAHKRLLAARHSRTGLFWAIARNVALFTAAVAFFNASFLVAGSLLLTGTLVLSVTFATAVVA